MTGRVIALLCWVFAGVAWSQAAPLDADERRAVVESAGALMVSSYVYPERGVAAKAAIDEALKAGAYASMVEPEAFARRLTDDLRSVTHDLHLRVFVAGEGGPPPPARGPGPRTRAGFAQVDRLKGHIGYIRLMGFPKLRSFAPIADQAMADLAGTEALIIDLRDNGGGDPESVAYLCSFFFDPKVPRHVNDLIDRKPGTSDYTTHEFWTRPVPTAYLRKPVVLLTSGRTFSGGEEFAYDLKVMNRARLIGETTGGGANPGGTQPLNARFGMFVPDGRAENPVTRTSWEGTGVQPHVAVKAPQAFKVAMLEVLGERRDASSRALHARVAHGSSEDALIEARLLKFRSTPQSGSEAALRQMLAGIARGEPDYTRMTEDLTGLVKSALPGLRDQLGALGAVRSVRFNHVDDGDLDLFDVEFANGSAQCGLLLTPEGKVDVAWWRPLSAETPRVKP